MIGTRNLICSGVGVSPRRDADHFAVAIHRRAAGVAAVDGDVRLKHRRVGDVALDGGDDAGIERRLEIAVAREPAADDVVGAAGDGRIADRPDRLADARGVGVAERERGQVLAIDAQQREVGAALRQRGREAVDRERQLLAVRQLDLVRDDARCRAGLSPTSAAM